MATEADIVPKILSIVSGVADFKTVEFDKVRVAISEYDDYQLPAAQLWDVSQEIEHERGRMLVTWNLALEIVMRSTVSGIVDQDDLLDLRRRTVLALFDKPNLEIPGVIHLIYTGNITDLHMQEPNYIARVDFEVLYYDVLTGSC
jgi:hypothetical protein